jgi:hypothetical protein
MAARAQLVGRLGHDRIQVEPPALGRDQHAGIDQRRHRDFGSAGWRVVMPSSVSQ